MTGKLSLDARLGLDKFEINPTSHIQVDQTRCNACAERPCLTVCPACVYRELEGRVVVRHENCLECGTCQISCDTLGNGGITWHYPDGGIGVVYRHG